jgi:MYXO-CTERM domain-containing protein
MLSANVLVVNPVGTLVANDVGSQIWEVTITDGANPVVITVTISVNAAVAFTSSPTLTAAQLNGTYPGSTITWTGGTGAVGLAVTSGALPANLSMNGTGVVSGTTTDAVGTYNFTVTATDSLGASTALGFSIDVIDPPAGLPTITNGSVLPAGTLNTPYSLNLTVTGGTTPYTFSLDSGTLPSGLSLSAGGVISGTPGAVGPSTFTVRVVDSSSRGVFNSSSFTLSIIAPKKDEESSCSAGIGAGAPALLAVLGLAGVFRRRRKQS